MIICLFWSRELSRARGPRVSLLSKKLEVAESLRNSFGRRRGTGGLSARGIVWSSMNLIDPTMIQTVANKLMELGGQGGLNDRM